MMVVMTEFDYRSIGGWTNNFRIFIAIELPVEIKDTIATYIQNLKHLVSSTVKWVRPTAIHLN